MVRFFYAMLETVICNASNYVKILRWKCDAVEHFPANYIQCLRCRKIQSKFPNDRWAKNSHFPALHKSNTASSLKAKFSKKRDPAKSGYQHTNPNLNSPVPRGVFCRLRRRIDSRKLIRFAYKFDRAPFDVESTIWNPRCSGAHINRREFFELSQIANNRMRLIAFPSFFMRYCAHLLLIGDQRFARGFFCARFRRANISLRGNIFHGGTGFDCAKMHYPH